MTKIAVKKVNDRYVLKVEGHSGFRTYGNDIVCAAVSTLAFTWINELQALKERGMVEHFTYDQTEAGINIIFKGENESVKIAFETILTGFSMLEAHYPEFLRVSRGEIFF